MGKSEKPDCDPEQRNPKTCSLGIAMKGLLLLDTNIDM